MPWCRVTVIYAKIGYHQNYKRRLAFPSQRLKEQFNLDAMLHSLDLINANLPPWSGVVAHHHLGLLNPVDQLDVEPGHDHTQI